MTLEQMKALELNDRVTEPSGLGGIWGYRVVKVFDGNRVTLKWDNSQYAAPSWVPEYITPEIAERFTKEVRQ